MFSSKKKIIYLYTYIYCQGRVQLYILTIARIENIVFYV